MITRSLHFEVILLQTSKQNKWSNNFDKRPIAGANFSRREKYNVTPMYRTIPFAAKTAAETANAFEWTGQPPKLLLSYSGIWNPSNT